MQPPMNHPIPTTDHTRTNPCTDTLSDIEYLQHMIPHHQVAIDMSRALQATGLTNPTMLHMCRTIIRKQDYEIWEMTLMKRNLSDTVFNAEHGRVDNCQTKLELYDPYINKHKCNPLFFEPDNHQTHMMNVQITEKMYLEHMIPHHLVAVDMSKRLLLHTNHSYLIDFCRKLILDQQYEVSLMKNLIQNTYHHTSSLLH